MGQYNVGLQFCDVRLLPGAELCSLRGWLCLLLGCHCSVFWQAPFFLCCASSAVTGLLCHSSATVAVQIPLSPSHQATDGCLHEQSRRQQEMVAWRELSPTYCLHRLGGVHTQPQGEEDVDIYLYSGYVTAGCCSAAISLQARQCLWGCDSAERRHAGGSEYGRGYTTHPRSSPGRLSLANSCCRRGLFVQGSETNQEPLPVCIGLSLLSRSCQGEQIKDRASKRHWYQWAAWRAVAWSGEKQWQRSPWWFPSSPPTQYT